MPGPVYVYYQLDNFYQNHRRYVKSRSFDQLNGNNLPVEKLNDCDPIKLNKDIGANLKAVDKVTVLNPDAPAIPCGLVAKSVFTDRYTLQLNGNKIDINETDISWESDRLWKFKNVDEDKDKDSNKWKTIQWLDMRDGKHITFIKIYIEHFIVWMRTAGLPNFRKLWGRIDKGLEPG